MDSSYEMMEALRWAGAAAGIVGYLVVLVAAGGFFAAAGRLKAKSLNVCGIGLAVIGLTGLLVRIFYAAAPRLMGYSEGMDWAYSGVSACSSCVELVCWAAVAIGLLTAKPGK